MNVKRLELDSLCFFRAVSGHGSAQRKKLRRDERPAILNQMIQTNHIIHMVHSTTPHHTRVCGQMQSTASSTLADRPQDIVVQAENRFTYCVGGIYSRRLERIRKDVPVLQPVHSASSPQARESDPTVEEARQVFDLMQEGGRIELRRAYTRLTAYKAVSTPNGLRLPHRTGRPRPDSNLHGNPCKECA